MHDETAEYSILNQNIWVQMKDWDVTVAQYLFMTLTVSVLTKIGTTNAYDLFCAIITIYLV